MVNWTVVRDVAVVTISNPPLNASNHAVRRGLVDALEDISTQDGISGVVLTGAGANFVAGSDIKEFGAPLAAPQMPDVISVIENFRLPVIAAIRGACLGGGFELALGCDYRLAAPDAVLGLPEVRLGIVPGAGGTQKLPRLTGIPKALELILAARHIGAAEAEALGMIDAVIEGDLMEAAIAHASSQPPRRRIIDMDVPDHDSGEVDAVLDKELRRARYRPAARSAADLVLMASRVGIAEGLAQERRVFQDIRVSAEAFALRHVFFAERAASKFSSDADPVDIRRIAVIGGGTMGAGIAYTMLKAGFPVTMIERDADASAAGRERVEGLVSADAKREFLTQEAATDICGRFEAKHMISAVSGADLVIEAVFEDMEVKKTVLTSLMPFASGDTLIATNTSYLDVDEMAQDITDPSRFFGLHFFSPAHRMSLVEIVRGAATSELAIKSAFRLARKLGKQPVLAGNAHGFIGNRIYAAYRRHADYALQDGAGLADIDAAMKAFGMAMGPFEVADMSGLDISWNMRRARGRMPGQRYVDIADRLCEEGRFGRKTGAGYYSYEDGSKATDPHLDNVIADSQKAADVSPQTLTGTDIQNRLLGAIVLEAAQLLSEGITRRASDVDVVLIHGHGFPRWTGGPLCWASQLSSDELQAMFSAVELAEGAPVPIDMAMALLEKKP